MRISMEFHDFVMKQIKTLAAYYLAMGDLGEFLIGRDGLSDLFGSCTTEFAGNPRAAAAQIMARVGRRK